MLESFEGTKAVVFSDDDAVSELYATWLRTVRFDVWEARDMAELRSFVIHQHPRLVVLTTCSTVASATIERFLEQVRQHYGAERPKIFYLTTRDNDFDNQSLLANIDTLLLVVVSKTAFMREVGKLLSPVASPTKG